MLLLWYYISPLVHLYQLLVKFFNRRRSLHLSECVGVHAWGRWQREPYCVQTLKGKHTAQIEPSSAKPNHEQA